MNNDQIKQLANEAGASLPINMNNFFLNANDLSAMIELAISKERRACANICHMAADAFPVADARAGASVCAKNINARSEVK